MSSLSSELLSHWSLLNDVCHLKWNFDFRIMIPQPGQFEWTKEPVTSSTVESIDSVDSQSSELVDHGKRSRILLRKKHSGFKSKACRRLSFDDESAKSYDAKEINSSSSCAVSKSLKSRSADSLHPTIDNA